MTFFPLQFDVQFPDFAPEELRTAAELRERQEALVNFVERVSNPLIDAGFIAKEVRFWRVETPGCGVYGFFIRFATIGAPPAEKRSIPTDTKLEHMVLNNLAQRLAQLFPRAAIGAILPPPPRV